MLWTAIGIMALCAAAAPAQTPLSHLEPGQVRLGGEMGRRIDVTINNNLLVIDLEKDFLAPFQKKSAGDGYVGLGKTLDGMTRLAACTGDARLIERKNKLVADLLATQEPDGYIGMMKPDARVSALWDVHEMSYLVLGLTADYAACGNKPSLEGARRLADYLLSRLMVTPRIKISDLSPHMPDTGFEEAVLALHGQTGNAKYLDAARNYRPLTTWHPPITLGRWGGVEGHAYAYIDKCLSQIRLNPTPGETALWAPSRDAMQFLLDGDGLVVTGTCGDHECWHNTQSGTTNNGETCTTTYLLRFWDELYRRTGNPVYGDLMERAIYNALFAAQSPDGRHIRYYTPFETRRAYHEKDTYCCPCNYRRAIADLPGMVYYRTEAGIRVNLYTPSEAKTTLADGTMLRLVQETDYPNSGRVSFRFELDKPSSFAFSFRVPRWTPSCAMRLNGKPMGGDIPPGTVHQIATEWKTGDSLTLDFAMDWRLVKGRRTQAGRAAVMRGPQLFALDPKKSAAVKDYEPRLLTLDPASVTGPQPDATVRPEGLSCKGRVWMPGAWYPSAPTEEMLLTEFADPDATSLYFLVPNPNDPRLVDDELANVPTDGLLP